MTPLSMGKVSSVNMREEIRKVTLDINSFPHLPPLQLNFTQCDTVEAHATALSRDPPSGRGLRRGRTHSASPHPGSSIICHMPSGGSWPWRCTDQEPDWTRHTPSAPCSPHAVTDPGGRSSARPHRMDSKPHQWRVGSHLELCLQLGHHPTSQGHSRHSNCTEWSNGTTWFSSSVFTHQAHYHYITPRPPSPPLPTAPEGLTSGSRTWPVW